MASRLTGAFRATPVRRIFAKRDEWRKHPLVANNFEFNTLAPGFVNAVGIFSVFVVIDLMNTARKKSVGGQKYVDKQVFSIIPGDAGSCTILGCSESQSLSVKDFSTNYCDLVNLYCG